MSKKSEKYHQEVKKRLREGAKRVARSGHEPPVTVTQQDQAELESQARMHELRRHTDRRGRTVR